MGTAEPSRLNKSSREIPKTGFNGGRSAVWLPLLAVVTGAAAAGEWPADANCGGGSCGGALALGDGKCCCWGEPL